MQKVMYLLVSQHVSGIIMPIFRRMVQNRQRLWCTALAVLQKTRGEEVVGVHLLGMQHSQIYVVLTQYPIHSPTCSINPTPTIPPLLDQQYTQTH
jgi:hypothetical protein